MVINCVGVHVKKRSFITKLNLIFFRKTLSTFICVCWNLFFPVRRFKGGLILHIKLSLLVMFGTIQHVKMTV